MQRIFALGLLAFAFADFQEGNHHHHHGHHHHHHHGHKLTPKSHDSNTTKVKVETPSLNKTNPAMKIVAAKTVVNTVPVLSAKVGTSASKSTASVGQEQKIVSKMRQLEAELARKEENKRSMVQQGAIEVNGPLPVDFTDRFVRAVSSSTGCDPNQVKVLETSPIPDAGDVNELIFEGPKDVIIEVENQAADPDSRLANGPMRSFLLEKETTHTQTQGQSRTHMTTSVHSDFSSAPVQEKGIDIDTEMPYGELEPFGREDTAQELTERSVKESDEMVDQLERAEVAEEKRAVFRALTRLRGAAITSFDGVARSQTGNIDEYNKIHQWRTTHPLHHLADEESDITKWAFPDNAD